MGTFYGLTPPGRQETDIGQADQQEPPWSLRSATDLRIVPSSRSPNLERRRLRVSGARSREVQTGSMPLLVRVEIAEGVVSSTRQRVSPRRRHPDPAARGKAASYPGRGLDQFSEPQWATSAKLPSCGLACAMAARPSLS